MRLAIGCDHTALEMKDVIRKHLTSKGVEVVEFAPHTCESSDYPLYAEKVALTVRDGASDGGILICGTGAGMCIAANKVKGIRALVCSESYTARLAKEHNGANIICFGARVVGQEVAKDIVDAWLNAEFQGGRHEKRVDMFEEIEKRNH